MKQRILTGLIFGVVSLAMILFSDTSRILYVYLGVVLSVIEYLTIIRKNKVINYLSTLIIICLSATVIYYNLEHILLIALITSIISVLFIFSLRKEKVSGLHSKIWPIFILVVFGLAPAIFCRVILDFDLNFLLVITILIWIADSGAYFVGKSIGKKKLAPKVSPKKTWEGFIGGGMVTAIVAYIIHSVYINQFNFQYILILGLAVWFFGAFGDLIQSHIKRSFNFKDSGDLLPGHGGFYDRFDGFIYVLSISSFIVFYLIS